MVKSELNSKVIGKAIRYAIQRHTSQQKLKELSANLSADQERYLEAQKMGKFGCWEMDIVSHEMYWSDEVFKLFGFQHQSFQPTMSEYMNYVHTDDKEKVEAFFDATSKANGMINVEHRIITEGRNIKYISIQSRLVNDSRNQKIKVVGAIQDVTERKLNEKLMIEKNISRGMLNVKEQMLSDIGFQIRTPLSSITNMLFLLENMPGSSRQSELVDGLKNSFDELFGAVNNLLNYAMVGQDNLSDKEEEFKLEEFVGAFKRMALLKAGANNVKIDFNLSDSIPAKVMTYPKKLTQLFYNIANLAFTDDLESQEIDVQAGMADHQANQFELKLKGYKPDFFNPEMIALLKAEDYKTILDNVENTQNHHLLNVAILNKIIRQINGNLEINLDKDSLIMSLPVKKVEKVVVDINAKAPSSPLSVLLVEDHFLNQIATKKILTTWSSQVTVDIAENGLIGLEKHREHEYDLILMDLQMPVMNGFDSSTKIREMSDVPIIALTASASAHEETKCKAAGINAYLTKPFKPEDLHMKIMELLGSRQEG
jgi:CheY-like chemotaxis protein